MLEELLEQEKREQARHIGGASDGSTTGNQLISDQVCFNFVKTILFMLIKKNNLGL